MRMAEIVRRHVFCMEWPSYSLFKKVGVLQQKGEFRCVNQPSRTNLVLVVMVWEIIVTISHWFKAGISLRVHDSTARKNKQTKNMKLMLIVITFTRQVGRKFS